MGKQDKKKAGKRMKKAQLAELMMSLFQTKSAEVLNLKYIFAELNLNTHPLKMLCMDILYEMLSDDYISEVEKGKYKLNKTEETHLKDLNRYQLTVDNLRIANKELTEKLSKNENKK